mgnify:CR=1 FL=1
MIESTEDKRSSLLNTACRLYAGRGYDAVGIQELVDSVGVTKPTLYHYFGSKRGLLEIMVREYGQDVSELVRAAADYQNDLSRCLERIAFAILEAARTRPDFYRMLLSMYFAPAGNEAHQVVRPLMEELYRVVEDVFRQAASQHGNMIHRHQAYSVSFLGLVHTLVGLELSGSATLTDTEIRQMLHQFEHGIYS